MHAEPTTFGAKFSLWALQVGPRPRAAPARHASGWRSGKLSGAVGTYSNIDPRVEAHVCRALGLTPGTGHPGDRPRPPRRVPLGVRLGRRHHRVDRDRGPPPGPERARRGRGAVRAGPEGQLGHAPQAQPDPVGAAVRVWPGCCAAICRPGSRTSPSGTSATSPTARSSGWCSPTPRMLTLYMLQQGHRSGRGAGRPPRAGPGHPARGQPRPGVQPVGAARPGRRRARP